MPRQDAISAEGARTLAQLGLAAEQLPRHVAVIMDGNGRWAQRRGRLRVVGHKSGIKSVRAIVEEGCRLGLDQLTLYCLSVENWKRPPRELDFLLRLLRHFLINERAELMQQNVRLVTIGSRDGLTPKVIDELDQTIEQTALNDGLTLCLAINYGGRSEIVEAARSLAIEAASGRIKADDIDESMLSKYLYTSGMPDPDLLIRTAGEMRVSNFLLWQISYAELYVTEVLWPDFRPQHLHAGLLAYAKRRRTFGALPSHAHASQTD